MNKQYKEIENIFINQLRKAKEQQDKDLKNPKYFVNRFDIEIVIIDGEEKIKFCGDRQPIKREIEAIKVLKSEIMAEIKKRDKEFEDETERQQVEFENKYHNMGEE